MSRSQRDFREGDCMSRPSPSICWLCNRLVDRVFASMLKILARYSQTGLGFSARPNGPENLKKSHVIETEFQPGPKNERKHAHWLCFRTSVNFLTKFAGWNWARNHNKVSARWAERNFSPGWRAWLHGEFHRLPRTWLREQTLPFDLLTVQSACWSCIRKHAENPSPEFSNRARIFSPAKRAWKSVEICWVRNLDSC